MMRYKTSPISRRFIYVCQFLEDYHREQELIQTFERMFGETPTTADISYLKLLDK